MLQEIAEYFRRTEPHSPLAYALEQAVRWGRTPLPKLLEELIPDPGEGTLFSPGGNSSPGAIPEI